MTEIETILYHWVNDVSQRAISRSLGVARNTISPLRATGREKRPAAWRNSLRKNN